MFKEGHRVQETKSNLKRLLAREDEHEAIVLTPDTAGADIAREEPQVIGIVPHVEQAEIAVRDGNRLHADNQPFVSGLVFVLKT